MTLGGWTLTFTTTRRYLPPILQWPLMRWTVLSSIVSRFSGYSKARFTQVSRIFLSLNMSRACSDNWYPIMGPLCEASREQAPHRPRGDPGCLPSSASRTRSSGRQRQGLAGQFIDYGGHEHLRCYECTGPITTCTTTVRVKSRGCWRRTQRHSGSSAPSGTPGTAASLRKRIDAHPHRQPSQASVCQPDRHGQPGAGGHPAAKARCGRRALDGRVRAPDVVASGTP